MKSGLQPFSRCLALAAVFTAAAAVPALAADTYNFDSGHTEIRASWSHFGISRMSAVFTDFSGQLSIDTTAPETAQINVTIKPASVYSRVAKFDEHLKSPDFFDTAKFGEITFKSTKVEKTGDKTAKVTGDLTMKGITKPVVLDVTLNFNGAHPVNKKQTLGFGATTTVKRTEFDLGKYAPAVSDDVTIEIQTEMNKAS